MPKIALFTAEYNNISIAFIYVAILHRFFPTPVFWTPTMNCSKDILDVSSNFYTIRFLSASLYVSKRGAY